MFREKMNLALISEMTGIPINELEELVIIKKTNYSFSDASITIHFNFKYYKCGDELAIYDSYFDIPFFLTNGKVQELRRGRFNDDFNEVLDPLEIALLFNDEIKQKFINSLKQLRQNCFVISVRQEYKQLKNGNTP